MKQGSLMAFGVLSMLVVWGAQGRAAGETVISGSDASGMLTVVDVRSADGVVSGTLVNKSDDTARDVQLLIRHPWLWNTERHPGTDSPGRASFYSLPGPIPPYGSVSFRYEGRPLPEREDGHFTTEVQVVGFTQVGSTGAVQGVQR